MKRAALVLTVLLSSLHAPGCAQDGEDGSAALESSHTAREMHWQNWVFAGGALAATAIGIIIVSLNTGSKAPE